MSKYINIKYHIRIKLTVSLNSWQKVYKSLSYYKSVVIRRAIAQW